MSKEISAEVRQLVINYYKDKKSLSEIKKLVGRPNPTIQTMIITILRKIYKQA